MSKIIGRVILKADLVVKTGLHIGGGSSSVEIGGIDNSVIKNYKGQPFIPGSSLKGKMRSLTELVLGHLKPKDDKCSPCQCGECSVCKIYGVGAPNNKKDKDKDIQILPTRVIVRDAFLKPEVAQKMYNKKGDFKELELNYTESKWENQIDRLRSTANPRLIERVPEDAVFETEFIYTVFNKEDIENLNVLIDGFKYLEDDYLGANGTRGYGKVEFKNINISLKKITDYSNVISLETKKDLSSFDSKWIDEVKNYLISEGE
ncbi:MAG: type III-A CRISPR-associated RAMP protein Csm3 [Clostridium sp.]|nr:type III-A CRISPR-associated RAMP protein Csm3 [Clostridium sp.]